jgi:UDP-glucuronate decarboxylase
MRILVTGGAGFIGSHVCERLLDAGHEVLCLDNFFTGTKQNIRRLLDHSVRFEVLRHDVIQPVDLEIDRIFNLACPASPVHYQRDPVRTVQANVLGVTNMLELARRTGARILQASTSEVYGNPTVHPQTEDYWGNVNPIGPRSCYDEGKRIAETLLTDYHRQYEVEIRIARIFNTYGPRMSVNDGRVVSNFIIQALKGEPLRIHGEGDHTRSFCYVDDMVDGLLALQELDEYPGPINIGNPEEHTILKLAELIVELTRSPSTLVHEGEVVDDPVRRCPDIGQAHRLLKWKPSTKNCF